MSTPESQGRQNDDVRPMTMTKRLTLHQSLFTEPLPTQATTTSLSRLQFGARIQSADRPPACTPYPGKVQRTLQSDIPAGGTHSGTSVTNHQLHGAGQHHQFNDPAHLTAHPSIAPQSGMDEAALDVWASIIPLSGHLMRLCQNRTHIYLPSIPVTHITF